MADVLSKSNLFSICENQSSSIYNKRREFCSMRLRNCSPENGFLGKRLDFGGRFGKPLKGNYHAVSVQMTLAFPKAMKWWRKGIQPNMKEIESAQDLNDSLLNAGNKLVVVDFFSPGCGGCRALHPKICQFVEVNPDVLFLQVNYEEHKSMCYSLNVHVLPFFRFYRGPNGRVCSFSCTNATIKKFRDALAKNNTERCSPGPAKGLEESELLALASNKDLSFTYARKMAESIPMNPRIPALQPSKATNESQDKSLITAGV